MLVIPGALRTTKRKKQRKHKKKGDAKNVEAEDADDDAAVGQMSPLMLPAPALPVKPLSKTGKKLKRKKVGSTAGEDSGSVVVAEAPAATQKKKGKKRALLPPSPTSQAAELERGEGSVLGKKRRKNGGSTSPSVAPKASGGSEGKSSRPSERRVAFDLKSTEVMNFKKKDKVAKASDPTVEKEGHSKSALRKHGKK